MPYTPNVPLAAQPINSTQQTINDNFTFIQSSLQTDHYFNDVFATQGAHKQVSMANIADPAVLPAGINAIGYVIGGNAFLYNGTKRPWSGISGSGNFNVTSSFTTLVTLPADCVGFVVLYQPASSAAQTLNFHSTAGTLYPNGAGSGGIGTNIILAQASGLNLQIKATSAFVSAYKYIYWPI